MTIAARNPVRAKIADAVRKSLLPAAALAGLIALSGCYYYGPYGYYGYPGYAYAGPPVVGGVVVRGGGYYRGWYR